MDVRTKTLILLFAWMLLAYGCGSDTDNTPGDSDSLTPADQDSDVIWPPDGDTDDDTDQAGCEQLGCDNGRYCDPQDGLCKVCTEDRQCGDPDPLTGITPLCLDGVCKDLVCSGVIEPVAPEDGASLPVDPLAPSFNSQGILSVENRLVFPIGVQGIHPDKYEQVKGWGANLVISNRDCCLDVRDYNYQLDTVLGDLAGAGEADLFAAVRPIWPPDSLNHPDQLWLMKSVRNRNNRVPLLFWMGADRPEAAGFTSNVDELADFVRDSTTTHKPFAVAEDPGFAVEAVESSADLLIATIDPTSVAPGAEIARVRVKTDKPIWARIPAAGLSAQRLYALAIHCLAAQVTGLIFEVDNEDSASAIPDAAALQSAIRKLRDRTSYWLSQPVSGQVDVSPQSPEIGLHVIHYEGKVWLATLVNTGTTEKTLTVTLQTEKLPYCYGVEEEDQLLHLNKVKEQEIILPANGVQVLQFSEAASPGESR